MERSPSEQYLLEQEDAEQSTAGSQDGVDDIMVGRIDGGKPNAQHDDAEHNA